MNQLTPEQERQCEVDKIVAYRACFGSAPGKKVLSNMLAEAHFFEFAKTPEEQAVENFMKKVLCNMGIWSLENSDDFVDLLMNLPVIETKVKEIENG